MQVLQFGLKAEVSSVTNFSPSCAGIFLPASCERNNYRMVPPDIPMNRVVSLTVLADRAGKFRQTAKSAFRVLWLGSDNQQPEQRITCELKRMILISRDFCINCS